MANKELFKSSPGKQAPAATAVNHGGAPAYAMSPEHALAQLATTGCLRSTYYVDDARQLSDVLEVAKRCSTEYLAKCAVYARKQGLMKDMPALLCVIIAGRAVHGATGDEARKYLSLVFARVIDNEKMLRNFVQILRSGVSGRKSMGTHVRKLIREWLAARTPEQLFKGSVGNNPTLKDIIKLSHPAPGSDPARAATYKYLLGQPEWGKADTSTRNKGLCYEEHNLPTLIQHYEAYTRAPGLFAVPEVPFQMLTHLKLSKTEWQRIAMLGGWHFTRMNLNTFARHGVLEDAETVKHIANQLRDAETIKRSRVFPYQLLTAYLATRGNTQIPLEITNALQDALELATQNTPKLGEDTWVFVDVSSSMRGPITGYAPDGQTSSVCCVDVAALFAACVLRTTPNARVIPVDTELHTDLVLNPRDSVVTNAERLARVGGGGTALSLGLNYILEGKRKAKTIVFVSDNQTWMDAANSRYSNIPSLSRLFNAVQISNPDCKMVCIDIVPYQTTAAESTSDVLNVGGFNDTVWTVVDAFLKGRSATAWVDEINAIDLVPNAAN